MEKKKWYKSKGVWLGAIAFIGGILQATGVIEAPISPETQVFVIGIIAFIIRLITKKAVEW